LSVEDVEPNTVACDASDDATGGQEKNEETGLLIDEPNIEPEAGSLETVAAEAFAGKEMATRWEM